MKLWFGKKNELGTQGVVLIDPVKTPEKKFEFYLEHDLRDKFDDIRLRQAGLREALDQIALQMGAVAIDESFVWKEVRERYNLKESDQPTLNYHYDSGRLYSYDDKGKSGE